MSDRPFKSSASSSTFNPKLPTPSPSPSPSPPPNAAGTKVTAARPPPIPSPDSLALPTMTARPSAGLRVMFADDPPDSSALSQSPAIPAPPPLPSPPINIPVPSSSSDRPVSIPIPIPIPSPSASPPLSPRSPMPSPTSTTVSFSEYITSELNNDDDILSEQPPPQPPPSQQQQQQHQQNFQMAFVSKSSSKSIPPPSPSMNSNSNSNSNTQFNFAHTDSRGSIIMNVPPSPPTTPQINQSNSIKININDSMHQTSSFFNASIASAANSSRFIPTSNNASGRSLVSNASAAIPPNISMNKLSNKSTMSLRKAASDPYNNASTSSINNNNTSPSPSPPPLTDSVQLPPNQRRMSAIDKFIPNEDKDKQKDKIVFESQSTDTDDVSVLLKSKRDSGFDTLIRNNRSMHNQRLEPSGIAGSHSNSKQGAGRNGNGSRTGSLFESGEAEVDLETLLKTKSHRTIDSAEVRRSETTPMMPSMSMTDDMSADSVLRHYQTEMISHDASLSKGFSMGLTSNNRSETDRNEMNEMVENATALEEIERETHPTDSDLQTQNQNQNQNESQNQSNQMLGHSTTAGTAGGSRFDSTRGRGAHPEDIDDSDDVRRKGGGRRRGKGGNGEGDDGKGKGKRRGRGRGGYGRGRGDKESEDEMKYNLPRHFYPNDSNNSASNGNGKEGKVIGWMKLDCFEINAAGKSFERSLTKAELIQEARSAGPNPLFSPSIFDMNDNTNNDALFSQHYGPISNSTATSHTDDGSGNGKRGQERDKKLREYDVNTLYHMLSSTTVPTESKKAIHKTLRDYLRNSLQMRDIRQVDPAFVAKPALWVRHSAIVLSLDGLRAIILHNKLFIFEPAKGPSRSLNELVCKFLAKARADDELERARRKQAGVVEESEQELLNSSTKQPFEFNGLEAILTYLAMRLEQDFARTKAEIDKYLNQLPKDLTPLQLEELRRLKQQLKQLISRLNSVKSMLDGLLDDNDEMINMYLTEKFKHNIIIRDTEDHSEIEILLETYLQIIDEIYTAATLLDNEIEDTEDLVMIHLDTLRNKLLSFELSLTIITMSCTFASVIAGAFGMNFNIAWFNENTNRYEFLFWIVVFLIAFVAVVPAVIILQHLKRTGLMK